MKERIINVLAAFETDNIGKLFRWITVYLFTIPFLIRIFPYQECDPI
jgi:hypothetical protein